MYIRSVTYTASKPNTIKTVTVISYFIPTFFVLLYAIHGDSTISYPELKNLHYFD